MLTIGCDPELFLQDAVTGSFISAVGKIGGTKYMPRPLSIGNGFGVQEDNVAVEFTIPPAQNINDFKAYVKMTVDHLREEIKAYGLTFSQESATTFPEEELQTPEARMFGCDPDFNAWKNGRVNPRPKATDQNLRSAGGHVHVGFDYRSKKDQISLVQHLDLFLGVPSVVLDEGDLRKQLYGKAGAMRFKPYGVEYRTLSNFWIFKDELVTWVWNAVERAVDVWQNKSINVPALGNVILESINGNNKGVARDLCNQFNLVNV